MFHGAGYPSRAGLGVWSGSGWLAGGGEAGVQGRMIGYVFETHFNSLDAAWAEKQKLCPTSFKSLIDEGE